MKEILINVEPTQRRVAILEDGNLSSFFIEREDDSRILGNIYKGKVKSIVGGIQAAFVDIGGGREGFLHASDIISPSFGFKEMLGDEDTPFLPQRETERPGQPKQGSILDLVKKGQEFLVQVVKEPIGNKSPRLTTEISLPGRYLVLMPTDPRRGISRRIEDEDERKRLKNLIEELRIPAEVGVIIRTVGEGKTKREFQRDLRFLLKLWAGIKKKSLKVPVLSLVHREYDISLRVVRDLFSEEVSRLVIDSKKEYKRIVHFVRMTFPNLRPRIFLHEDKISLFEKYKLELQIEKIFRRKVPLKCGGYITIDRTEGMIAIDVNTGKYTKESTLEKTIFETNREAATEAARQVRLRNMGGIIIIDFIDMRSAEHRRKVLAALRKELALDKAKTDIVSVSDIDVVELTRQRTQESLENALYETCPYCHGRGAIKSPVTISAEILRQAKKILGKTRKTSLQIIAHPLVSSRLANEDRDAVSGIERDFRTKIVIKEDSGLHIEDVKVE